MRQIPKKHSNLRRERGVAIPEMAIAIPVVIMLFLGVVDFARAMWTYNTLQHSAREVVRYAAVHSEDSGAPCSLADIETYAHNRAVGLDPARLKINTTYTPSNTTGATVRVDLIYDFSPVVPILPDSVKRLVGSSQMRVTY